ncbi:MFS transporter [Jatrophihabitans sp.]|uniref:MFS transporter n=1 Tax=Jatrophihabitans sp. TaxID=1932789 RepID=UPI002BAD57AC|nr:MFS transporter [Jatrophihabitans sp.]
MTNVQNVLAAPRTSFRDALRVPEFRVMWLADAQSMVGDQLARVALSVLVFERTSSALLTALTYALTFLPALIGGAMLTGLADRLPRRRVMIAADLIRAVLLTGMAIPGTPLWLVCGLLVCVVLVGSPFSAAESALLPEILSGETFVVGSGLRTITNQMAQLGGFAFGGMAVAAIGARAGLAVDAVTFALSAVLISLGVHRRPSPAGAAGPARGYLASILAGAKLVAGNPRLRTLLGFSWLLGLYVVPEGVAPPYAHSLGAGSAGIGLLMAAGPAGTALGTYLFLRYPSATRAVWMPRLAVLGGLPLVVCWLHPGIVVSIMLWTLSGMAAAYQVQVATEYVRAVPAGQRGQAVGVAASGLLAMQGVGILLGGVLAARYGAATAVGLAGLVGAGLAMWFTLIWARIAQPGTPAASERTGYDRQPGLAASP